MPWPKGQRGHPGGRSQGSRRKLTDAFIRVLARDWKVHGEEVIQRVREDNPAAYFRGRVSLLPKDVSVEGELSQAPLKTQPLSATIAFLESVVSACDDPRVNEDGGEPRAEMLTNNKSETSV
jgi:hypothetical protein